MGRSQFRGDPGGRGPFSPRSICWRCSVLCPPDPFLRGDVPRQGLVHLGPPEPAGPSPAPRVQPGPGGPAGRQSAAPDSHRHHELQGSHGAAAPRSLGLGGSLPRHVPKLVTPSTPTGDRVQGHGRRELQRLNPVARGVGKEVGVGDGLGEADPCEPTTRAMSRVGSPGPAGQAPAKVQERGDGGASCSARRRGRRPPPCSVPWQYPSFQIDF